MGLTAIGRALGLSEHADGDTASGQAASPTSPPVSQPEPPAEPVVGPGCSGIIRPVHGFGRRLSTLPAAVAETDHAVPADARALHITDRFAGPVDLPAIIDRLAEATEISLDFETTSLTPWSPPLRPGKGQALGGDETVDGGDHASEGGARRKRTSVAAYCAKHECEMDVRPRPRILSLETDSGLICAVDLDQLTADERVALVRAATHPGSVWVGHNLQFDLMWLQSIVPGAAPGRIVDTMLLTIACRPDTEADIVRRVADVPDGRGGLLGSMRAEIMKRAAKKARSKDSAEAGLSLRLLSMHLLGEDMDKSYQKPHNWMPGVLSAAHLAYCLGDTRQPRLIARRLLNIPRGLRQPIGEVLAAIDRHPGGAAYKTFETAVPRLVRMQRNGIRLDPAAAAAYRSTKAAEAEGAMAALIDLAPSLTEHRTALLDPGQGLTKELKDAIAGALETATGKACPRTEKSGEPKLGHKALVLAYPGEPLVGALSSVGEAVKRAAMIDEYLARCDDNHRLHPMTSILTITGRTSSQEPNLQNMPRDPAFRECFAGIREASATALGIEPTKILASDFSAIEMRIAACLAERAYSAFVKSGLEIKEWITRKAPKPFDRVMTAIRSGQPALPLIPPTWPLPAPARGSDPAAYAPYYASRYAVVLARLQAQGCGFRKSTIMPDIQRMALPAAFRNGIDPHLLTALQSEVRAGRFDPGNMTPIEYITMLDDDGRKGLKAEMAGPRKAAKAPNFGLLYGMSAPGLHDTGITNYGLDWTADDAVEARNAWFEFYPEIELWHLLLKNEGFEKRPVTKRGEIFGIDAGGKLFSSRTLSHRPVCGGEMRDAANYSDQGTQAEIALDAINRLPGWLLDHFVNFVHDELVFEVPASLAEQAKVGIEAAIIAAGDAAMSRFQIPTGVETEIGDFWIH